MADYIRRDDAVKIAEKYGLANGSVLGRHTGLADCIASEISGLPAADVAEVVRCKDRKYGDYDSKSNGAMICLRTIDGFWRKETDFCSYGEYQTNTGGSNNVAD